MAFLHFSFNPNETFLGTVMIRTKFDPQLGDNAASKNDIGFVEKKSGKLIGTFPRIRLRVLGDSYDEKLGF